MRAAARRDRAVERAPARRFSSTVIREKTWRPSGDWTMPARVTVAAGLRCSSTPSREIVPLTTTPPWSGRVPEMARSSVDLPAPLLPRTATTWPSGTSTSTPSRTDLLEP